MKEKRLFLKFANPVKFLLRDDFNDTRAAGAVNGTTASPGGMGSAAQKTRTIVDTENKLSLGSGVANLAAPKIAPSWGDPGLWYGSIPRAAGRMIIMSFNQDSAGGVGYFSLGFNNLAAGNPSYGSFGMDNSNWIYAYMAGGGPNIAVYSLDTTYNIAVVLRAAGAFWFIKGGVFTFWTLLWIDNTTATNPLYPALVSYSARVNSSFVRIPDSLWLPTPLCYDTFTRADAAIGTSEVVGPDGQSTTARIWTGATWTISTNKVINTPVPGAETLTNGNMETADPPSSWVAGGSTLDGVADERTGGAGAQSLSITSGGGGYGRATQAIVNSAGIWMRISGWSKPSLGGSRISIQKADGSVDYITLANAAAAAWLNQVGTCYVPTADGRASLYNNGEPNGESRYDDISIKPLTTSELFSSVSDATTPDVIVGVDIVSSIVYGVAAYQAGIVVNLDSTNNPQNYIIAYLDKSTIAGATRILLDEVVAGVLANKITVTNATYVSGARLVVVRNGTQCRVFYNNLAVGTVQTMTANTNTKHGLFSTDVGNTFNNFLVMPRGTRGEYNSALNRFI
jgi:hypothetical protein